MSTNFAQPDITLGLDTGGLIRRAILANEIANEVATEWVGRRWADTVTSGTDEVHRMIEDAKAAGISPFRELVQRFPSGRELRIEYATVSLGADAGLIAVGRSLQAVSGLRSDLIEGRESMERDFWKLRDLATRYRLQFDLSREPMVLVDGDLKLIEANPIALEVVGHAGMVDLDPRQQGILRATLARVREQGRAPGVLIRFRDRQNWLVRASVESFDGVPAYLLRLTYVQDRVRDDASSSAPDRAAMRKLIEAQVEAIERQCVAVASRAIARSHNAPQLRSNDDDESSGSA